MNQEVPYEEVVAIFQASSNLEGQIAAFITDVDLAKTVVRAQREWYFREERGPIPLLPGISDLLVKLKASGIVLGLVTSGYRRGAEGNPNWGILRELRELGLTDMFSAVVGYEDTDRHKPEPDPFLAALELLAIRSKNVVAVGDSPFDIHGAKGAGIAAAAALWGTYNTTLLLPATPDLMLEKPEDLLRSFNM